MNRFNQWGFKAKVSNSNSAEVTTPEAPQSLLIGQHDFSSTGNHCTAPQWVEGADGKFKMSDQCVAAAAIMLESRNNDSNSLNVQKDLQGLTDSY